MLLRKLIPQQGTAKAADNPCKILFFSMKPNTAEPPLHRNQNTLTFPSSYRFSHNSNGHKYGALHKPGSLI